MDENLAGPKAIRRIRFSKDGDQLWIVGDRGLARLQHLRDAAKTMVLAVPATQSLKCAAISDEIKETDFFFYHSRSALNTIDKKTANYQKAKVISVKKIKTTTLNNVLDESIYKSSNIDFLSIDVEGSELSVLKNFNFHKFKPKVIVVEYLDLSLNKLEIKNLNIQNAMNSEIYKLIISKNYTLANMIHSDLVFIYNDFRD